MEEWASSRTNEFADRLPGAPFGARGRGALTNPGNRYEGSDPRNGVIRRLHVLGEHLDECAAETGHAHVDTEVIPDRSRSIINRVDVPDVSFNWTINPYRGCEHGCVYCYARQDHERLGYSCGIDFETKIIAKFEAPTILRRELAHPKWQPEGIVMSGVTDPYQPVEKKLRITRGCLEVLADCRQPVSVVTKNHLITRDLDLLGELASFNAAHAVISLTTLDNDLASKMEPRASSPRDRLQAIRECTAAGIPVTAMMAPIVPGLTDREIPDLLQAASDAGATHAHYIMLRLPHQLKALVLDWLSHHYPDRARHVESLIRGMREGELYDSTPGVRRRGKGPIAEQIRAMFRTFTKRYGLNPESPPLSTAAFRRPTIVDPGDRQLPLFP